MKWYWYRRNYQTLVVYEKYTDNECRIELAFDSKCYYAFFLVCCGCDTSYIVSVHIHCQSSIYTLSLCRGHSWRVRLAKQETLTPPRHLVSPLICRGPWMSTVVLYCWCHSDGASVLLYFAYTNLWTCGCCSISDDLSCSCIRANTCL